MTDHIIWCDPSGEYPDVLVRHRLKRPYLLTHPDGRTFKMGKRSWLPGKVRRWRYECAEPPRVTLTTVEFWNLAGASLGTTQVAEPGETIHIDGHPYDRYQGDDTHWIYVARSPKQPQAQ